ncbi:MAG: ATP-binding protein, partial [Thermoflexus sp.]
FPDLVSHEDQVHELLRGPGGYPVIPVDLPDLAMRRRFGEWLAVQGWLSLEEGFSLEEWARISGGLRLRDLEDLARAAAAEGQPLSRAAIREWKARAIRGMARELVEVVEPEVGFQALGGLAHVRAYFARLRDRLRGGDPSAPSAILLAGVPGTGKSFTVLALAGELEIPVLTLRNIRERWVGASERNLERVLQLAEALAPCLIWIDEVDQALGQRSVAGSSDAGTSERMLARLWEFMGDARRRGRILWVATTNRPDLLDPATVDRFQVVIPFIHPSRREVGELLPILAQRMGRELKADIKAIVPHFPALITIRGLQEVLAWAADRADQEAGKVGAPIQAHHLEWALRDYKPNFNPYQHEFIALTALRMTSFQSLLPWRCRDSLDRELDLPPYLQHLVDEAGNLLGEPLEERLQVLRERL